MWLQSVFNAISEVEHENLALVKKVAELDPEQEWSEEDWRDYSSVAAAIVEPFRFPGGESEDEDFYYERTERDGFGMVKGNIDNLPNAEMWRKICDLIEIQGY